MFHASGISHLGLSCAICKNAFALQNNCYMPEFQWTLSTLKTTQLFTMLVLMLVYTGD